MSSPGDYVAHGWKLCAIPPGEKGPRTSGWNVRGIDPTTIPKGHGVGLLHALSGTCALDIDDFAAATLWLSARGIDLPALLAAPDAVQISSGRPNRAKLLYRCDTPRQTHKPAGSGLELRSRASTGFSVQDVLPPSIHPDTKRPYAWKGDWRKLPVLPAAVAKLWDGLSPAPSPIETVSVATQPATPVPTPAKPAKDCTYDEWIRTGMGLHAADPVKGFAVWDAWSRPDPRYKNPADLAVHWKSFRRDGGVGPEHVAQVALDSDFEVIAPLPPSDLFMPAAMLSSRPPAWLVSEWIPRDAMVFLVGPPGAGKSFAAVGIACAVAAGAPGWLGATVAHGPVCLIISEGRGRYRSRIEAWHEANPEFDPWPNLSITKLSRVNFSDVAEAGRYVEAVNALNPVLVVVDTLAANADGDENDAQDMKRVVSHLSALVRPGRTVLVLHHPPRSDSGRMRGSSVLDGAADAILSLTKLGHAGTLRLSCTKQKDAEEPADMFMALLPVGESAVVVNAAQQTTDFDIRDVLIAKRCSYRDLVDAVVAAEELRGREIKRSAADKRVERAMNRMIDTGVARKLEDDDGVYYELVGAELL